jgi:acetylornithine aminotransferase/acetylornithine/N-succinyldiaminopimelate aminotransferase
MAQHLLNTYHQLPLTITKGQGSYVWDDQGNKYLDFYGGHAVCLLGHCPPAVTKAIQTQAETLIFYSNVVATLPNQQLAAALAETFDEDYKVFFSNSGSEANETALKIARKFTGRSEIISFHNAWHGRAVSTLSVTGYEQQHIFEPNMLAYTHFADFGDIETVKKHLSNNTAAVILEPIQSIGGLPEAEANFFTELAELCKQNGTLLIFDEVQTGMGRTGDWWYHQTVGVTPDMVTTAKGIASGVPLSAVFIHETIAKTIAKGEHATTFGGGALACAAGLATFEEIQKFRANTSVIFDQIKTGIKNIPGIGNIRGKGCLIGIETEQPASGIVELLRAKKILVGAASGDKHVMRVFAPMNSSETAVAEFLAGLQDVCS